MLEKAHGLGSEQSEERPRPGCIRRLITAISYVFALLFLGLVGLQLVFPRGTHRPRAQGQLLACKSNCKNIATALEIYASDNKGRYPLQLDKLLERNYLKQLPTCPSAGTMTYQNYRVSSSPDAFSFACCGSHHVKALGEGAVNLPRYRADQGLIEL